MSYHSLFRCAILAILCVLQLPASAQLVQIGSGTQVTGSSTASPVNIWYRSSRFQIVYTKQELNAAGIYGGKISELGWYVDAPPAHAMPNYSISLLHTSSRDASTHVTGTATNVYQNSSYMPVAGGFDMLQLNSPWRWNGTDNIVVDVCWDRVSSYNSSGQVRYYNDSGYVAGYTRSDGSDQCGQNISSDTEKPQIQFLFQPISSNDAGVTDLNQSNIVCAGSQNITTTVGNFGNNVINSLSVNWSVNDVAQSSQSISSALDTMGGTGSSTQQVNLGSYNFVSGNTYNIKVWTSQPNGVADTVSINDTLRLVATVGMGGTYTIGGVAPDYSNFTSAVNDILNSGICGPVTFTVRDGSYNEQIEITAIPGASDVNTISFESESGDSSLVTMHHSSGSSNNYVVRLNNASHVRFKKLGFEATNSSYGRVVEVSGEGRNISFQNNVLKGVNTSSSSTIRSVVYYNGGNSHDHLYRNNRFENGSRSFYYDASDYGSHFSVVNNIFLDPYYQALVLEDVSHPVIDNNYITTNSSYSSFYGINLYDCDSSVSVQNNHIHGASGGYGISVQYSDVYAPERGLIANNFVQIGEGTHDAEGIRLYSGRNFDVAHNSVNITSDNSNNEAFYHASTNDVNILNNNFKTQTGYAYYIGTTSYITESDNNNLYSNTEIAYWGGAMADLAALQAASSMDSSSVSENPYFINDTSYQVAQVSLNNAGTAFNRLSTDIEGEVRDVSTPDIGADEFTPTGTDAGVIAIKTPNKPFAPGAYPVKAIIKNYGGTTLTNATLNWEQNEVAQTAVNWTGSLASGDTALVTLGTVNFATGIVNDFKVFTSNPNSGADLVTINDSFELKNIAAALGGTYTIGGTSPDFIDFTTATEALNIAGVYAAVTFDVRSGTYTEQINILKILRNDPTHSVTYQSEAGDSSAVILKYTPGSADNYVVRLNGAEHIRFKDLTLYANSTYGYGRVMEINSSTRHLSVINSVIKSNTYSSTTTNKALVYSSSSFQDEYLVFDNVHFQHGSYGIYLDGNSSSPEKGVEIKNCFFDQQYAYGLFTEYSEDLVFEDNLIEAGADLYSSYYLAYFDDLQGGSIQRNQMYGGQYGINGLWINNGDGTSGNPILVTNNFVQIGNSNSDYGIRIDNCHYLDLVHNSVWVNGGDNNTAAFYNDYSNASLNAYNNIFQNTGGGYAFYSPVTYGIDNSDHNNLYTSGPNIGYWSGDVTDLNAWIATTNLDSNSLNMNVQFTATNDLHTNTANLNAAGIPIASVTHDIDMQPRDMSTPDIGADEFDIPTDDAAITALQSPAVPFVAGARDVKLQLFNNGADTLNSVTIQWEVNGVAQIPFSWTGALPSGESLDSVSVGNFNFVFDTVYTIKAWTENPNSAIDAQPLNDTILVEGLYPALQGIYTIGGTTPDFPDFTSAVQALQLRGVDGWVTFNVRAGNYNEQLVLKEFIGASSQDTVVFQSEAGDSSQVKLFYQGSYNSNYVIRMDGVDHIGFKDLVIQNKSSSYGRTVELDSGVHHNYFVNVAFLTYPSTTTSSANMASVYMSSTFANDSNSFINSRFHGGSYGMRLYGPSGYSQANRIIGCDFEDQYYRGILLDNQEKLEFSKNGITSNSSYSGFYGIYLTDVTSALIFRNEIHSSRYGVYLNDFDGTSSEPSILSNNFIYLTGTNNGYGIYLDASNNARVVHNSVLVLNTDAGTSAFQDGNNSNAEVLNNIFQNEGGGYAVDYFYTYTDVWANHNNLYTTGSLLGEWGSTTAADLEAWKTTSQLDTSSISVDAQFVSSTDLHTDNASLDRVAQSLAYVTDDIDGDPRDAQYPDIGADEFSVPTDDAALTALQNPKVPFVAGNQDVIVELFNNGADTLNNVTIQWEVNGVAQTPYNWSGALPSAQGLDSVNIGNFSFDFATEYAIKAWTENPNNDIDAQPLNDTILVEGLYPALQGIYTIGGTTPDFPDFTSAVEALNLRGAGGWVTFNVRAGNYNEQLVLKEFPGASDQDTVVFQSEAGDSSQVKLFYQSSSSNNNYVLQMDGVDHIGFKDLVIQNTGSSYGRTVELDSGANHNYFVNVAFLTDASTTTSSTNMASVYMSSSFANDSNSFVNSKFHGGSYAMRLYGPSGYVHGNRVIGCDFEDQYYRALLLDNQEKLEFSQNTITSHTNYSSFYALYLTDVTSALISRNEIHSSRYGAYLNDFDGTSSEPSIFSNNFIYLTGSNNGYGIYLDAGNYSRVVHNSVLVTNTNSTSSAFQDGNNSNAEVLNNIFQNEGGGYAVDYFYTYTNTLSDYNNLFTTGTVLGEWGNTTVADLEAWQSTSQLDTSSLSMDAEFAASDDLHVNLASLNGAGISLAYITDDFDGDPRDPQNPDIGADEFTPNPNDVSLVSFEGPVSPFTAGNQTVYLDLLNNGADTLRSVIIEWTVNGVAQPSYNWSGTLLSGNTLDSIPVGTYNFSTATYHDIVAWTSFPNSSSDADPSNDTLVENDLYPALSGTYTIGGTNPDFNTFTEAVEALSIGGITGWVTFNVRSGDYQEQLELGEIVGSNASDTILFQSELRDPSLLSLSHNGSYGSEHTLKLNGTDFISFRDITFKGENSSYAHAVVLDGATEKTNFIDCRFWIAPGNSSSTRGFFVEDNDLNKDLRIIGSRFTNGGYGLYADGNNAMETGLELRENFFSNQYYRGVYLRDYNAPVITGNEIFSSSNLSTYNGIYLNNLAGGMQLSKNKVYQPFNGQGIYITNFSASSGLFGLIANNFVSVSDSSNGSQEAVEIQSSNFLHIYHNSFLNDSASGYALYLNNLSNSDIKNNNIIHQGSGHALYMVNNSSVSSDYNNLYSTGNNLTYDGSSRADLASWQSASSMDINSVSVDPLFASARDLHVSLSDIDSAAFPLSRVTDDIDGEQRDPLYPDIGADEVLFFPDDIMVAAIVNLNSGCGLTDSSQVSVKITNKGSDAQSGFDLVMVLGNDTTRETINTTINGGTSMNYTFAPYVDFTAVQPYDFTIWSELTGDVNLGNDTLSKSIYNFPAPSVSLTEDTVICAGTTLNLQASGGTSYSWNNGSNGATIFVTPSDTTVFTVTVTDINGCTATDSVKVSVATPPTSGSIMAGGSTNICFGDSLLLYSTVADDITWSTGESNDSIYVSQSGNYTLSYNKPGSVCGQVLLDNISVNVVKDSIKLNSFQTICLGDAVILTATNFASGTWSTGETSQTITAYPTADSTFYATWTGSNGCQFTDSVRITVKPALPPAPVSNMTPVDGTLNLQTPVGFSWAPSANAVVYDLYVWKKGSARPNFPTQGNMSKITASLTTLNAGEEYYWQIAAENSCFTTFSDTLEFSVIDLPDLTIDTLMIPPSALSGNNITITYTVKNMGGHSTGSKSWYDYIWLSTDEDLRRADDELLAKVSNLTYLDTGQTYTNTVTVQLPQDALSTRMIFVSTDNDDAYCATPGWVCYPGAPRSSHFKGMKELDEQNNYAYDTLPITPSPAPDLVIPSMGAPSSAFSGDEITLTFDVKNIGNATTDIAGLTYCFFISPDSNLTRNAQQIFPPSPTGFRTSSNISVASSGGGGGGSSSKRVVVYVPPPPPPENLHPDSSKIKSRKLELPNYIFGTYYLHAYVDCGDGTFEALGERNNFFSSIPIDITLTPPPDMQVDTVRAPDTAYSGKDIAMSWSTVNKGATNTTYSWPDSVFLCSTPIFNRDSVVAAQRGLSYDPSAGGISYSGSSSSGGSSGSTTTSTSVSTSSSVAGSGASNFKFTIPQGISGHHYFFVKADAEDKIFEYPFENNNLGRADTSTYIIFSPYPDMQVTNMTVPATDTGYADTLYNLQWTLENLGTGPTTENWKDEIYISASSDPTASGKIYIGSYSHTSALEVGQSVTRNINFKMPNKPSGTYYFHVITDVDDDLYEYNFENNNNRSSTVIDPDGFYLKPRPVVTTPVIPVYTDLEALSVNAPDSSFSGRNINVSWDVTHNGPDDIASGENWEDRVYLSTDTVLDNADVNLGSKRKYGPITVGANYTASTGVQVPNGIAGDYYLIVRLNDKNRLNSDTIPENNMVYRPIHISLTPPPDLVITSFSVPAGQVFGGQQVYVPYTVKNQGVGDIYNKTWSDAFYLNSQPTAGGSGIGDLTITDTLAAGDSYTDSILVSIPAYASGNYYLVLKADNLDKIYEHSNEGNNTSSQAWFINSQAQLQTDLVVDDVNVPDTLMLGSMYSIPYQIRNAGSSRALGTLRNGLYLGAGPTFNSQTDELFGFSDEYISLNSGFSFIDSITSLVEGVNAVGYYGIFRTNINAAIQELDYSNNDSTVQGMVYVDAEALTLGVADSNTLDLDKPVYYKVDVAAGEDLLISLNSQETDEGINEVFVAHERVPSANDFDHQHQLQPGLNQEVLISNTQAGTYYILATTQSQFTETVVIGGGSGIGSTGGSVSVSTTKVPKHQDVSVKAEILPFSILSVSPSVVGQGVVTTNIRGAGFRDSLTVGIEDEFGTTVATADLKNFVNSTDMDLLWDLSSVSVGTYDVVVTNPDNSTARLPNGLQVDSSSGYLINLTAAAPNLLRVGKSGFYSFFLQNTGNVDVPYVKADISIPAYANVKSTNFNGDDIYTLQDMQPTLPDVQNWQEKGDLKNIPMVVRNLQPGEQISIDVSLSNFPYARFPYRFRGYAIGTKEFIEGQVQSIKLFRESAFTRIQDIQDPGVIAMLYNEEALIDSILGHYIDMGLIDPQDTAGIIGNCMVCDGDYDYSPGTSPGYSGHNQLNLMPGEKMLWEINHPEGDPGAALGWDVLHSLNDINITSTSANPFQIDLKTLSSWDNSEDFLTSWSPGYDQCWPVMIADGSILGFDKTKFIIDDTQFKNNTPLHNGHFELELSPGGDTLYLCFKAANLQPGENGVPGGDGHYGQDGGRGGPGGPCDPVNNIPPGAGGSGGKGGPGVGGYLSPGKGGEGGPGGNCNNGAYSGGTGGTGGNGGIAGDSQNGGAGGDGGNGGFPGGDGGDGGDGGASDDDTGPGPGGDGGDGDNNNGPDNDDGDDGEDGDDGPDSDDPDNPNNPDNPDYPRETPPIPPNGPPGGPNGPTGPGTPPSPPPGIPPASCNNSPGGGGSGFCDYFKPAARVGACGNTAFNCITGGIAGTLFGGPVGLTLAGVNCGLGILNCSGYGNVYTKCASAVLGAATGKVRNAAAGGAACLSDLLCDETPVTSSCDPNEIKGPPGYGEDRFVAADEEMDYTIFYENDSALATTAAQRVEIRQEIHPNMDPLSLKLTEFGFADTSFKVPNVPNYTVTIDLTDDFGVDVEFTAGVDVINNEFFWIFQSIDKGTGASPYDPLAGFLAVNDSVGSGEGYVKYTIRPDADVGTGDSITAQAEIIFDVNSSIITNTEFNIIDAVAPTSTLDMLAPTQDSTSFSLSWNATDDAGGSGVGNILLYASENGGPYTEVASNFGDSSTVFTGNNLSQYQFFTVALDNVGNREAPKQPETFTFINASNLTLLEPGDTSFCVGDTVEIRWRPGGVEYVNLLYSVAADSNYIPIAIAIDSLQTPYTWVIPDSLQTGEYLIRVSDTNDLFFSEGDTIEISKYPVVSLTADASICTGDSVQLAASGGSEYLWNASAGISDTTVANPWVSPQVTTTYYVEVRNAAGCGVMDSVTITVNDHDTTYLSSNTCDTTQAGVFTTVLTNQYGCDSVVIDTVIYRPDYLTTESTVEICQGDSLMLYGEYRAAAGVYHDTLRTYYGCDSVLAKELIVNPVFDENLVPVSICDGDSAMILGEYQTQAGIYYDSLSTASGCDSIVSVTLQVDPVFSTSQNLSICQGDSILLEGTYQKAAGTYTDVFTAINGCDSTVTSTLSILPNASSTQAASVCAGDSMMLGGSWQTTAGSYVDVYPASNGCDSVVTTNLSILPQATASMNESICAGDSIMLGGSWQTSAGSYIDTYTAANGCDSTVTTTLTVHSSYYQQITASICQGDSMMLDGSWQSTAGTYTDVYQTSEGCDSVITTTLSVISNATSSENISICAGDSMLIAGAYRSMAGAYSDTFSGPGCDSIHTVNLSLLPIASSSVNASICDGDSIQLEGNWQTTAGIFHDTLVAANGCDSVVTTSLSVTPVVNVSQNASICQGDSMQLGGSWQTTAGVYTDVFTGSNGCDSIVATTLSVLPNATGSAMANICQGDSIMLGGSWQTTAGSYVDVYTAANGCDSTVNTMLTITPDITANAIASICQGDSILLGGSWQTAAGSYVDTYPASNGCDSIVTTSLTVMPVPTSTASVDICPGDSIQVSGNWRSTAGTYVDTLIANNGCDSLHIVNLGLYPDYNQTASSTICQGDSILLGGSWRTTAGTYTDSFSTVNGCDSIIVTTLAVQGLSTGSATASICQGDSIMLGGAYQTSAGTYVDTVSSAAGCDSVVNTTLSINTVDTAVSVNNAVLTANATGATYRWIDCNTGQYISGETGQSFAPAANGLYAVEVTENGCTDTSSCRVIDDVSLLKSALDQLTYHPNPTRGKVNIDLGAIYGDVTVTIIGGSGKRLEQVRISGEREFGIDLSSYADGSYFLYIKIDEASKIIKVVKE